jgi:hypothetical protein
VAQRPRGGLELADGPLDVLRGVPLRGRCSGEAAARQGARDGRAGGVRGHAIGGRPAPAFVDKQHCQPPRLLVVRRDHELVARDDACSSDEPEGTTSLPPLPMVATGDAERPRPSAPKDERGSEGERLVLRLRPRRVRLDGVALCDLGGLPVLLHLGYAQQEPRGCLRWTARLLRWLGGRTCPGGGRPGGGAACDGETGGVRWPRVGPAGGVRRSGRGGDRSALPGPWGTRAR